MEKIKKKSRGFVFKPGRGLLWHRLLRRTLVLLRYDLSYRITALLLHEIMKENELHFCTVHNLIEIKHCNMNMN
ncbi:MAG TPA: hypothetical protein PLP23_11185 [Panacibacter sp.]|nr:hypothetical protein [Panacibacter sp.]